MVSPPSSADGTLSGSAVPVVAAEGSPLNVLVATFSDSDLSHPLSSYNVTIDWGDGTPTTSGRVEPGDTAGSYKVFGCHTYTEAVEPGAPAKALGISVTIAYTGSPSSQITLYSTAAVDDPPLVVTGTTLTAIPGGEYLYNIPVATLTDADLTVNGDSYQAFIDWGDGSFTTAPIPVVGSKGHYYVRGTHRYVPGTYRTFVNIFDDHDNEFSRTPIASGSGLVQVATLGTWAPSFTAFTYVNAVQSEPIWATTASLGTTSPPTRLPTPEYPRRILV
jgi:hypothetical protein